MFAGCSPSQTSLIYLLLSLLFLFGIWRTSLPRSHSRQMDTNGGSHSFPSLHRYCVWSGVLANTKCGRKKSTWNVCYGNPLTTPRLMSIDSEHTYRELPLWFHSLKHLCVDICCLSKKKKVFETRFAIFLKDIIVFAKQQRKYYSNVGEAYILDFGFA